MSSRRNLFHVQAILPFVFLSAFCNAETRKGYPCANTCRVFLCDNFNRDPLVRPNGFPNMLRGASIPMGGGFCSALRPLHNVTLGEALVTRLKSGEPFVPISKYTPDNMTEPYSPRSFRRRRGPNEYFRIVRSAMTPAQYRNLDRVCLTIPILKYRRTNPDGSLGKKIDGTIQDCVSMRVSASSLQFELSWNTTDDFDFTIQEPGGFKIRRDRPKSPSGGRFNGDRGFDRCGFAPIPGEYTRETIRYPVDAALEEGDYRAIAKKFVSCEISNTKFEVRAIRNGIVVAKRTGIAKQFRRAEKFSFNFKKLI